MHQHVNLYQPLFRRRGQRLSAAALVQAVGVAAVALLVVYAYGLWRVAQLQGEVRRLDGHEHALAAQVGSLDPAAGRARGQRVEEELQALHAALAAQQTLMAALHEQPLGTPSGFSAHLAALGRRHGDGVWLTELKIDGATGAVELAGQSVRPELVPEYLERLGLEHALAGQRFDRLTIERGASTGPVEFRGSSRRVADGVRIARETP